MENRYLLLPNTKRGHHNFKEAGHTETIVIFAIKASSSNQESVVGFDFFTIIVLLMVYFSFSEQ